MLGGALRGFNLLLVLAGMLVGALIIQWRWSRRCVESISIQRRLPTEAFVGKPFRVRFMLRNHSRLMPAWMMRVEETIESADQKESGIGVCAAGVIPPGKMIQSHFDCVVTRRGRYRFGPTTLMTTFPFALFSSRKFCDEPDQLHVFPELLTLVGDWQKNLISRPGGMATTGRRSGPSEGDFFGLREWQNGDNRKWIHWRTSARLDHLAVRQFEQQRRFDTCVLVDAYQPIGSPSQNGSRSDSRSHDDVERAISMAATFMIHLVGSPSNRVVLAIAAKTSDATLGTGSVSGKRQMLEMLAELLPTHRPALREAVARTLKVVGKTQDLIVVSPRPLATAMSSEPTLVDTIAPWVRRGAFRWIDVNDREVNRWVAQPTRESTPMVTS